MITRATTKRLLLHMMWIVWLPTLGLFTYRTILIENPDQRPSREPGFISLERQTESFTCGVHVVSTIYQAYGLDPSQEAVRQRLGADTKAVFWQRDSTGVLPGEMLAVFYQDFFKVQVLNPKRAATWMQLQNHLGKGQLASVLIRRRETGGLHWVVAAPADRDMMMIYDSLKAKPQLEGESFYEQQVVTALLVEPLEPAAKRPSGITGQLQGVLAIVEALPRMMGRQSYREAEPFTSQPNELEDPTLTILSDQECPGWVGRTTFSLGVAMAWV